MCPWPLGIILKYRLSEFSLFVLSRTSPNGHFAIFTISNHHAFSLVISISTLKPDIALCVHQELVVGRGETLSLPPPGNNIKLNIQFSLLDERTPQTISSGRGCCVSAFWTHVQRPPGRQNPHHD